MNINTAFQGDERAVSPVIGVILMVAITVILAAVIGTFVLGLGDQVGDSAPQASFSIDDVDVSGDDPVIEVTKTGGQDIELSDLRVVVDAGDQEAEFDLAELEGPEGDNWRTADTAVIDGDNEEDDAQITIREGDTTDSEAELDLDHDEVDEVTVTIVHKPSGNAVGQPSAIA